MSLGPDASLTDVAFAVCTKLDRIGITAVLTGGSAATYYEPMQYQSLDADFVLRVVPDRRTLTLAMTDLGFSTSASGLYVHPDVAYTVEFPPGPLAVGRQLVTTWTTARRDDELLHVLSVDDCCARSFSTLLGVERSFGAGNRRCRGEWASRRLRRGRIPRLGRVGARRGSVVFANTC